MFWKKLNCCYGRRCVPVPFRREFIHCFYCGLLVCCLDEKDKCLDRMQYTRIVNFRKSRQNRKRKKEKEQFDYELLQIRNNNNNYLERALEINDITGEFDACTSSHMVGGRHLSKSASELSSPREMPEVRPRSAAPPEHSHISVYQKAHSFFAQLKTRLGHSSKRGDKRHKSPGRQESSDYAADLSSEHSTPSTASPIRHRTNYTRTADSPLSRTCAETNSSPGGSPKPRAPTPGAVAGLDLLPLSSTDEVTRRREAALRQHSFFQLRIYLRRGHGLVAMDKNGLSDPYVKFKIGGRLVYKSRTIYRDLNPTWDESFTVPIEDPFLPITIKVFDYDWGLQDDFMGSSILDLTTLELNRSNELALALQDPSRPDFDLGEIFISATLYPKSQEDKEQYFQKNTRSQDVNKRLKSQIWSSVVTIVLIEGRNLLACDPETGTSDPYVKFRLGNEKYKSRTIWRSLNPRWLEQLDLHLYDDGDQQLEITVWDKDRTKDDYIGRCVINLMDMEREKTYNIWQELEDGAGSLHLLLTISGTTASETISDLTNYEENYREKENIYNRYLWHRTFHNLKDVGHLTVKVYKATGLAAADIGGKSDPFCVLELGNARLQTQTEYKTLTPQWNKIFTFNVKDINNVLEIVVYDEDRDHKVEFLGKVAIPLLRIRNSEKRWYALKDKKLRTRAKGNSPQILLEMNLVWNPIRACIRTLNPKEEKFMQTEVKFKRQVFVRNVLRLKVFVMHFLEIGKLVQDCFEWESKFQSFMALVAWLLLCYYFQPWMIPVGLLLIFMKQYVIRSLSAPAPVPWDEIAESDIDEEDEDEKEKEEKKSLKERLQAIQEVTQGVQNAIGKIASLLESLKNMFNFTVPYLSWIAIWLLVLATFVLYLIPIRFLLMMWATNKFLRRIFRPHVVPNNEILDLLSRIPDDEMLIHDTRRRT
ncbi:multiple C2 and transmembrane domain-containing protein isoform X4 [Anthonomus grandis grandis]|uniref:multiple C2 and transmembrane domain-containing protein isoform X4 n=1 Tax=Anthonomus grandis grandis TaxID=2921223 RepID=UPI0021658A4C|nr:multiple C2 and transmembrane domain-containing protein isoform X4 [Anthonomus grandis grandis]